MATQSGAASGSLAPGVDSGGEEAFKLFLTEVKQIEKRDSVLTPKQQIERLTRPGSTYINLNPFEVLQIDPEATDEELKKRFRQLSILVHPDKNQDDPERAQKAFEAVDKAYKMLLEPEQKKRAIDVIQAARETIEHNMKEKRKALKKEGKACIVEEDDPETFKQLVHKQTMKLFAELEIKRKEREAKDMHERKRQREEEIEQEEKAKRDKEWQKNFESCIPGESTNMNLVYWRLLIYAKSLKISLRKVEMVVLIAGETSKPIKKARKKRNRGVSSSHQRLRWSSDKSHLEIFYVK
ncbi:dnaJ homolog subfamily C member 8 isoform X1 [Cetorhinus maximus]